MKEKVDELKADIDRISAEATTLPCGKLIPWSTLNIKSTGVLLEYLNGNLTETEFKDVEKYRREAMLNL